MSSPQFKILALSLVLSLLFSAKLVAQEAKATAIDQAGLDSLLNTEEKGLYVLNFWASWCRPCVEEMPDLVAYAQATPDATLVLVSMDSPRQLESKVIPFIRENEMAEFHNFIMTDNKYNDWMPKVSGEWQGSIPATLVWNSETGKSLFHEGKLTSEALAEMVEQINKD